MVAQRERYEAVLKSTELKEFELMKAWKRIDGFVEERKKSVKQLTEKLTKLDERTKKTQSHGRVTALRQGKLGEVALAANYVRRLSKERSQLAKLLQAAEEDLKRAVERSARAEQELVEARKERKKIETLIAREQQARQIRNEAHEELFVEEATQRVKRGRE